MITISETGKSRGIGKTKKTILELRGLSSDKISLSDKIDKFNIDNGSIFIEIDTGKIYMFDLDSTTWSEI